MYSAPRPVRDADPLLVPAHGVPTPPDSQEAALAAARDAAPHADPVASEPAFASALMTRVGDLLFDPSSDLTLADDDESGAASSDDESKYPHLLSSDRGRVDAEQVEVESLQSDRTLSLPLPPSLSTRLPFRRFSPSNPFACSGGPSSPALESPLCSAAHSAQHVLQPGLRPQNSTKRTLHNPRPPPPPKKQSIIERGKMTYVFRGQRVTYLDPEDSTDEDLTSSEEEEDDGGWDVTTRPGVGIGVGRGTASRSWLDPRANPRFKPKRLFAAEIDRRARASSMGKASAQAAGSGPAMVPVHAHAYEHHLSIAARDARPHDQQARAAVRPPLARAGTTWVAGRAPPPRQVTSSSAPLHGPTRAHAGSSSSSANGTAGAAPRQNQTSISSFFRAAQHPNKAAPTTSDMYSRVGVVGAGGGVSGRKPPCVYSSTAPSSRSTHA